MKKLRCILGSLLAGVAYCVLPPCAIADSSLPVSSLAVSVAFESEGDFLSVSARAVPLHTFLMAIAAQAGFQLTELIPIERAVSVICRKVPLDVALRQLLQEERASFMFVYRNRPPQRLQQVMLLRANDGEQARFHGQSVFRSPPRDEGACVRLTAEGVEEQNNPRGSMEITVDDMPTFGADTPLEQILALTTSTNEQLRTAALEALGALHPTDERARRKIIEGLGASDVYVRSLSVGMLNVNWAQWPGAEELMMAALQDTEPTVRRHALQVLWEKARPRIDEVLNIALQDNDAGIREQAKEFLQEVALPIVFDP
jgi:hypothetical protein